eukprot:scaffold113969_cov27-Tisochrysis_lutea.AAC.1
MARPPPPLGAQIPFSLLLPEAARRQETWPPVLSLAIRDGAAVGDEWGWGRARRGSSLTASFASS